MGEVRRTVTRKKSPKRIITQERVSKLRRYFSDYGRLPTFRELLRLFELSSPNSATRFFRAAVEAGYIRKTDAGFAPSALLSGLKCFSSISAGFPSPAEDELCDIISLDEYLVGRSDSSFLVRVSGDSMTGAGIMPGDIIIVDRGAEPSDGDIVVAEVDGEWTLKYFVKNGRDVFLRAANQKYPDIRPTNELRIGGTVSGVIRRYHGVERRQKPVPPFPC